MQCRFSNLLWILHSHHRVSLALKENFRTYCEYNERYIPYLLSLELYQIDKLAGINIDASLIHALVERLCPETHTFHLLFGEMTVTLEDVSYLWGLSINGAPVTGRSDGV